MTDYRDPAADQPISSPSTNSPREGPSAPDPGKTMGIVAFIMSCFVTFFFVQIVGLILGIVAFVKSKKAGYRNQWAVAAIITSTVLMVLTIIVAILVGMAFGSGRW